MDGTLNNQPHNTPYIISGYLNVSQSPIFQKKTSLQKGPKKNGPKRPAS